MVFCELYYLNVSAIEGNYISYSGLIFFNDNGLIIITFSMQFAYSSCVYRDLAY